MYVCMCVYLVLSSLNVLTPLEYFVGGVAFDSDSQLPRPLGFWLYVVSLDALFWQTMCILFLYGGCMYIVGLWSRYICLYSLYGYILHCVFSFGLGLPFFPFDISRPRGGPHFLAGNFPSTFPCSNIFGLFVQVFQIFSECRQAGGPFHFLVSAHLSHVFGLTFGEVSPSVCYIVYLFQLYWWWCTGFVWLPACFEIGGFHGGFVSVLFVLA